MSGNDNVDGAGCLRLLKSRQRTKRKAPLPAFTVAIFGLDGAGKSSALLRLQSNSGTPPKTGWGFATADVHIPYQLFGRRIKFFDLGGSAKIRNIWSNYIAEIHGCIYVIDASNSERFKEAAEAFAVVFDDRRMAGKPFLILSNKQDYSGAARSDDIARLLGVDALGKGKGRADAPTGKISGLLKLGENARIQPCCLLPSVSTRNNNLSEGVRWLVYAMSKGGETLKQKVREDTVKQQVEWEREREEKKKRIEQYKRERELEEQSQSAMAEKNHVEKEPNTTPAPAPQASPTTLQSRASTSGSKTPPHTRSAKKVHPAPLEPTYDILQLSTSSMLLAEQVESDKSMVQTTCKMEEVTPAPFVRAKLPRILGRQSDVVDSAVELSR